MSCTLLFAIWCRPVHYPRDARLDAVRNKRIRFCLWQTHPIALAAMTMAWGRRLPGRRPPAGAKPHQNAACSETITLRGSPYQLPVPVPMVR